MEELKTTEFRVDKVNAILIRGKGTVGAIEDDLRLSFQWLPLPAWQDVSDHDSGLISSTIQLIHSV